MHPNVKVPYGLGNGMVGKTKRRRVINFTSKSKRNKKAIIKGKRKQCEYCSNILLTKNYARHLREVHDLEIRCPSKDCEYTAEQMFLIHQHWSYEHPFLQFPDIRKGTAFIYKRSLRRSPSNNNQKDVRQDVSALSAEDSLLAPLPYQATGSGFLSELSDLESDDESIFSDMTKKATPPETNGNASVAMNQSISDEISPEVRSTQLELIAQSNSQKPADVQAKSMLQVTRVFSIPESTFKLNAENDDIVSISDDKTNGEEQQTQAGIEQSVSPNQRVRQSGSMVQHVEMDTVPRPAVETDIISISDDEESVIDISDDTDEDGTTNAVEQVSKRAHISALQVLYMFQEVDPPIEVQDDEEGSLIEQQPQQRVNGELDENLPAPETIGIPQAAIDGIDDTMNDDFDWSLLQD
ncbi:uncharacterized protein LOC129565644 [Sitodiplosis mosellana]|uniref:uncharacterized protein LOC129565644 n=1 Tax=Sitodiplosis mosellana TaxID=263140 RepID=UPI0024437C28|nr:uncharacterized protein LOC129565644 [Sitodiplosis mosellana]